MLPVMILSFGYLILRQALQARIPLAWTARDSGPVVPSPTPYKTALHGAMTEFSNGKGSDWLRVSVQRSRRPGNCRETRETELPAGPMELGTSIGLVRTWIGCPSSIGARRIAEQRMDVPCFTEPSGTAAVAPRCSSGPQVLPGRVQHQFAYQTYASAPPFDVEP